MYSTPGGGRPTAGGSTGGPGGGPAGGPAGRGARLQGRYVKGRLPEGVDFAAYPGRSSTPLPTAESKSAERINQLKIWNEAATGVNHDKRMLTPRSKDERDAPGTRRTDSFKDARERHSASFNAVPTRRIPAADAPQPPADIYADRSDDEDDDEEEEPAVPAAAAAPAREAAPLPPPADLPLNNGHANAPVQPAPPAQRNGSGAPVGPPQAHSPGGESTHASQSAPQPKASGGCCVLV